jgi:hypothetical protein
LDLIERSSGKKQWPHVQNGMEDYINSTLISLSRKIQISKLTSGMKIKSNYGTKGCLCHQERWYQNFFANGTIRKSIIIG